MQMSRNWITRNWSPLRNFMVPLRELPEWRFFTIVNKNIFIHLLKIDTKTDLHVSWLLTVSRSTSCLWTWRRSGRPLATLSPPSSPPSEAPWAPGLASPSAWSLRSELFYGETFYFLLLQVIELLIDLGGRLVCPSKMWRWISDMYSFNVANCH